MRAPLGRVAGRVGLGLRPMPLVLSFGAAVAVVARCTDGGMCAGVGVVPSTAMYGRAINARSCFANLEVLPGDILLSAVTAPGAGSLPWDERVCAGLGEHEHSGKLGCRVKEAAAARWNREAPGRWRRLHPAGISGHGETARARVGVLGGARLGGTSSWGAARSSCARVRDGSTDGGRTCVLGAVGRACATVWLWVCRAQGEAATGGERGSVPVVVFRQGQAWQAGVVGVGSVACNASLDHPRLDSADTRQVARCARCVSSARSSMSGGLTCRSRRFGLSQRSCRHSQVRNVHRCHDFVFATRAALAL
jgi:hypothetical protein